MIRTKFLLRVATAATLSLSAVVATAQDVHFTQFDATPLLVNPAFTGAFDGRMRVAAIYRDQWRNAMGGDAAFKTVAASVDAPIVRDLSVDDYLAAGIQFYNDRAGFANLSNNSVLASIAYHKFLGNGINGPSTALSVGLQGGYTQKSIDISKLYFGNEFQNGIFQQGTNGLQLNNRTNYFTVNVGLSAAHAFSENFGITLGVGANNLNQPRESFRQQENSQVGLDRRYTGQLGAIIYTGERFSIRPGVLYQSQASATELVAGSEFNYIVGNPEFRNYATKVFAGGWWRKDDAMMFTAGVEVKGLRIGASYDYNTSSLKTATNGNGGFEISLRYIMPDPIDFARRLIYPCARF
jgi:type IX secretion system PorP/SprF family membrane protein